MDYKKRAAVMLGNGYFPKELPPAFTTLDFGRSASEVMDEWVHLKVVEHRAPSKYQGKKKRGAYLYKIDHTEAEIISAPKRGFERRTLHITHPVPQAFLTLELSQNWHTLQKWLSRQAFSLDRITVISKATRGIPDINFDAHRAKKAFIEATANWLVKTDITRFYPSIYTHSIPWAAYGKERVKDSLKLYDGSLADRIDQLLRACNRNQTIGIPVGPDTSRVIAEVISSSIDQTFGVEKPALSTNNIDRLQDDWFIGCATLEQAELVLSRITLSYRDFGLEINGSKTSIERTSAVSEQQWVSELGSFLSHRTGIPTGKRLAEFLSLGLRMQVSYPHQPVINYLISVIENQKLQKSDAGVVESFLLRAATLSPSSLSSISRVLINLHHDTKNVSVGRVVERLMQELGRHLENGNNLESIWILYTIRGLSAHVSLSAIRDYVIHPKSSALSLVLLDMSKKGLLLGKLPTTEWGNILTKDRATTSGLWLLAYEGIRHGWLPDTHGLAATPVFKPMLDRHIKFYDPRRNVLTSKSVVTRRRRDRSKARAATYALIQALRGFDVNEY